MLLRCGSACVTAALLGRFLPRLGPLAPASGPFFFQRFISLVSDFLLSAISSCQRFHRARSAARNIDLLQTAMADSRDRRDNEVNDNREAAGRFTPPPPGKAAAPG